MKKSIRTLIIGIVLGLGIAAQSHAAWVTIRTFGIAGGTVKVQRNTENGAIRYVYPTPTLR